MQIYKEAPKTRVEGQPWPLADAARFLGVSVRTLTRMAKREKLRLIRDLGRRVLVPAAEVQRLAQ